MFKKFKKNDKYLTVSVYAFCTVALLIALIFIFINFGRIGTFIGGLISAMSSFIYGFVIFYICNAIYKKIHAHVFKFTERKKPHPKLRSALSYITTYTIFLGIITLICAVVIPSIGENIKSLFDNLQYYISNFQSLGYNILENIEKVFPSLDPDKILNSISNIFNDGSDPVKFIFEFLKNNLFRIGQATIGTLFSIIVGFILSVYFLIYKKSIIARTKRVLCSLFKRKSYENIISYVRYTDKTFGQYIIGAIFDSTLVGIVVFIILSIIRIPYASLIGVIVAITNIIPFFGPFLGAIPSAIIILISTGKFSMVLLFAVIILIVQQIDGNLIAPHILGASTGLTPIGVIAAISVCSYLFGFVGMVIGVPLCAVITYYIGQIINKKLKKKNLPSDIDYYDCLDVFEDEKFIKASTEVEAQNRIEQIEKIEKLKEEELSKENAVVEAEEKILNEKNQS